MPASRPRSISACASSLVSPRPKSSGAEPTPPKFPHPRPSLVTSRPLWPRRRRSTHGPYPPRSCENACVPSAVITQAQLAPERADGDTASRSVAIGPHVGSAVLQLHVVGYEPGRSLPRTADGADEVLYAAAGR